MVSGSSKALFYLGMRASVWLPFFISSLTRFLIGEGVGASLSSLDAMISTHE
jgi:hypothetical protein